MKVLICFLLGGICLVSGILIYCQRLTPVKGTEWGNNLLRETDPDLVLKQLPQLSAKQPYALGSPGENPTIRSIDNFDPEVVINKPFPAIKDAPLGSILDAEPILKDSDLVLGVRIGKEARAYPISMLCGPRREIINDALGGKKIASTW